MRNYAIEIIDANLKQLRAIRIKHVLVLNSKAIGDAIKNERQKELNEINERISDLTKAKGIIQEALGIKCKKRINSTPNRCLMHTAIIERGNRMIRVKRY